jgi:hypothetical protein
MFGEIVWGNERQRMAADKRGQQGQIRRDLAK